jgi:hypothetical protein
MNETQHTFLNSEDPLPFTIANENAAAVFARACAR